MRIIVIAFLILPLAGCALYQAQHEYNSSEEQYKACLIANPSAPQQCEGLRLAMEADERKYQHIITPANSGQVTILNR